ncbi:MAG TPA: hypothetical protein VLK22_04320 [Candidatus Udaeobacter sp.]|nr:hypothetical protein [Candidatus Udaeobacter sp.]
MAQFQKGSPKDILRALGIMFGFIGAEDFNPVCVFALSGVTATTVEMVKANTITPAQEETIFETAKSAGLCTDMAEVLERILNVAIPDDFTPSWEIEWGNEQDEYDDEDDENEPSASLHATLVSVSRDIELECGYVEDIFSVYHACNELFDGGMMDQYEAARLLKMVIIKLGQSHQQAVSSTDALDPN